MIRNRWLWGAFAVLVSVSFVGMFTADGGCGMADHADPVAGTVDDLTVTQQDLQRARFFTELQVTLMLGRPLTDRSPSVVRELENMAWRRALALKKAEKLGLYATDREVVARIQEDPMFSANGVFQRSLYDQFADFFLARIGISRRQYDQYMREEVVIEKLANAMSASVWIAPRELEQHLQTYTDEFTVRSIALSTNRVDPVGMPDRSEIEAYYLENSNDFAVAEQRVVDYVVFPAENFMDDVTIEREAIEEYYERNMHLFRRDGMSEDVLDMDLEAFDAMATAFDPKSEYLYLEEVEDDIRKRLARREALFVAMDAATDFVMELIPPRRGEDPVTFDQAADAAGLTVHRSEPMTRMDAAPALADIDPMTLTRTVFELEKTPEEYFSNAVAGDAAAYVLALREIIPAGVPPLEQIMDEVSAALIRKRMADRLTDYAVALRRTMVSLLADDPEMTLDDALAEKNLESRSYEPFSIFNVPEALDHVEILNALSSRNAGEWTEPIAVDDETRMLLYVADREPIDEMSRSMLRRQINENLYHHRSQQVFAEWQDRLMDRLEKPDPVMRDEDPEPGRDMGRRPIL